MGSECGKHEGARAVSYFGADDFTSGVAILYRFSDSFCGRGGECGRHDCAGWKRNLVAVVSPLVL